VVRPVIAPLGAVVRPSATNALPDSAPPDSSEFAWADNFFTDGSGTPASTDNVLSDNGSSNVRFSWGTFIEGSDEQSSTSLVGAHGGHWELIDANQVGILFDYTLERDTWFNGSNVVSRSGLYRRSSELVVAFYRDGNEIYRTDKPFFDDAGTADPRDDAYDGQKEFPPILSDQVKLVILKDSPDSHTQFNYVRLRWASA
jgi:hypothetical protein